MNKIAFLRFVGSGGLVKRLGDCQLPLLPWGKVGDL
jgi:hypothetical protein